MQSDFTYNALKWEETMLNYHKKLIKCLKMREKIVKHPQNLIKAKQHCQIQPDFIYNALKWEKKV